ncbi:MAG: cold shock domain-containing protein [Lewinellaceae bacterium]|nr:cold shock domain-containing protein [Phaeodactylibacter sp.]MCB9349146.1 cold shock domain-containing protein [Lewinellaceae bacterium]
MFRKILNLFTGESPKKSKGKVKFFNRKKGYGFIEPENLDDDIFVHVTSLEDQVSKGDHVAFEVEASSKGLEARNVRLVDA